MSQKRTIGFIGQGFIGKNYADDFERRGYTTMRYSLEEPYIANKDKIRDCDYVFIAVPTPTTLHGFDVSIVKSAISLVGPGKTAVIKSTIVPGTTRELQKEFPDKMVIYSPEFLSEATAAHDASHPFSNIVGLTEDSAEQKAMAQELLSMLPPAPFSHVCSSTEAEIVKYTHNGSGYTQIVFFNLMYDLAKRHGCDWDTIQKAIEADPLINNRYARPVHKSGRGAGGHCFIKDVAAIRREYEDKIGNAAGVAVLDAMEKKNIELLRSSGKDLDLLADVYGQSILEGAIEKAEVPKLRSVRETVNMLVCTEAIDRTDPLLGFIHRWVEEFGRHANRVHVICLGYGDGRLPANVHEHSLGKESATGSRIFKRIRYTARFLAYAWRYRNEYDEVLVHLSPEYLIIGGIFWRLLGKRIGFWYNDSEASLRTRIAMTLADVIFYTDPRSIAAGSSKARRIATGIDTDMYLSAAAERKANTLLSLGRITRRKGLETVLGALAHTKDAKLDIYGAPGPGDEAYASGLRQTFAGLEKGGHITFRGAVLYDETPRIYASHDIFIHAGSHRGFNKTVLEAMAAGNIVVTNEPFLKGVVSDKLFVEEGTEEGFAKAIKHALHMSAEEKEKERAQLRAYVRRENSLSSVVPSMLEMLTRKGGEHR